MNPADPEGRRETRRIVEVAGHGVFNHSAQLVQSLSLGMDAIPKGGSRLAAVRLVLAHIKDDLAHRRKTSPTGSRLTLFKCNNKWETTNPSNPSP